MFNSIFSLTVSFNYTLEYSVEPLSFAFPAVITLIEDIVVINANNLVTLKLHTSFLMIFLPKFPTRVLFTSVPAKEMLKVNFVVLGIII